MKYWRVFLIVTISIFLKSACNKKASENPTQSNSNGSMVGIEKLVTSADRSPNTYYIDLLTGALNITDEDFSFSDIAFRRYYDPMRIATSYTPEISKRWKNPLGVGWQHKYNIYIEEILQINSPTDTIRARMIHEGKHVSLYTQLPDGRYEPRRGTHANLMKHGDTWKFYKPTGEIYYFGANGKLDSTIDHVGRRTTFVYSGNYLTQLRGKDNQIISFDYNSDSLLKWITVVAESGTQKFEYRYTPVTLIFGTDTFDVLGMYCLVQVLQHGSTENSDSPISLYKYYYENNNRKMVAKLVPHSIEGQLDTTWANNYEQGDWQYIWYDNAGQIIYHEINDDKDSLFRNDRISYRSYIEYFRNPIFRSRMDSTVIYIFNEDASTGLAHCPYDETFRPRPPRRNFTVEKRDYHTDHLGRQIFIERTSASGSRSLTKYYKDNDYNDTLVILSNNDTIRCEYEVYTLNDSMRYSYYPAKIKISSADSILLYYHTPDSNAPSFFICDSLKGELFEGICCDRDEDIDSCRYFMK